MSEAAPTPAKICTSCGAVGATRKCVGCGNTRYCDKTCQQRNWEAEHRGICVGRKSKKKKEKKAGKEDIITTTSGATKHEQAATERACTASGGGGNGGGGGRMPTPSATKHEQAAARSVTSPLRAAQLTSLDGCFIVVSINHRAHPILTDHSNEPSHSQFG